MKTKFQKSFTTVNAPEVDIFRQIVFNVFKFLQNLRDNFKLPWQITYKYKL